MNRKLKSPVENFINWENTKGKETFLIQPINGKNHEFSWEKVGNEARKICNYINSLNLPKYSKISILSKKPLTPEKITTTCSSTFKGVY